MYQYESIILLMLIFLIILLKAFTVKKYNDINELQAFNTPKKTIMEGFRAADFIMQHESENIMGVHSQYKTREIQNHLEQLLQDSIPVNYTFVSGNPDFILNTRLREAVSRLHGITDEIITSSELESILLPIYMEYKKQGMLDKDIDLKLGYPISQGSTETQINEMSKANATNLLNAIRIEK